MSGGHLSKEFFELVKGIGECRTKQEEDRIVLKEIEVLKNMLSKRGIAPRRMKELLIRMIYVEMLGHDASFAYIHAVNLAACRTALEKRVGYLVVSLTLHADHEFMYLLINSLLTDLKSDNFLETSMSLLTVCRLANSETIPAVLPLVLKALDHREACVRLHRHAIYIHTCSHLSQYPHPILLPRWNSFKFDIYIYIYIYIYISFSISCNEFFSQKQLICYV